jgi:hypothetical protein
LTALARTEAVGASTRWLASSFSAVSHVSSPWTETLCRQPACDDVAVPFVPDDFQPPLELVADDFVLEPLGPQHNEADHAARSSSMEHIRATPGYPDGRWPREMTLEENRADLERHARDFATRSGFTYTVLDPSDRDVIGCVYIYPDRDGEHDAVVLSWVRATHAAYDAPLRELVSGWLAEAWPFERVAYDGPA